MAQRIVRQKISDLFLHLAWAVCGQECDCVGNPFNPLARFMCERVNADDQWDEEINPIGHWSRPASMVSDVLRKISDKLDTEV